MSLLIYLVQSLIYEIGACRLYGIISTLFVQLNFYNNLKMQLDEAITRNYLRKLLLDGNTVLKLICAKYLA